MCLLVSAQRVSERIHKGELPGFLSPGAGKNFHSTFVSFEFWTIRLQYSKHSLIVLKSYQQSLLALGPPSGPVHGSRGPCKPQPPTRLSAWALDRLLSSQCGVGWAGDGYICGKDVDIDSYPDEELPCSARNCKKVSGASRRNSFTHTQAHVQTRSVAFQSHILYRGEVLWVPFRIVFLKWLHLKCSKMAIDNKVR